MDAIIDIRNLTRRFEDLVAVDNLNLQVTKGEIFGLVGPDGAGKTTTLRLLCGLMHPTEGQIRVAGHDVTRELGAVKDRIGYMAQESVFFPDLTLRENLNFAASLVGMSMRRRERVEEMVEMVGLEGAVDRLLRDVSGGEKRRLSLAAALIHQPDLLFLDEPTAGIDPILRRRFWEHFENVAEGGVAMVVTTQYVGEAAYCDRVGVLSAGRILCFDTPDGLRRRAFGGDLFDLVLTAPPAADDLDRLSRLPGVGSIRWLDDHSLRLVVEDAGTMAATLVEWAG